MTNKPMLSVERDLIERAVKACTFVGYEDAAKELRALLDKPEPEPVPVAWMRFDDDQKAIFTRSKRADRSEPLYAHPTAYRHSVPAAQHQGEPVAIEDERAAYEQWQWRRDWPIEQLAGAGRGEYFKRKFLDPEKYESERFNDGLAVWFARATIPAQAAPVAVVMPERMYSDSLPSWAEEQKLVRGWNACLAEVSRLNGVKP